MESGLILCVHVCKSWGEIQRDGQHSRHSLTGQDDINSGFHNVLNLMDVICVSVRSWLLRLLPPLCCSGVNTMLRKVAVAAASNPHVEIRQDGEKFYIKTSTSVRTTEINFHVGEEFDEETVDGRKCKVNSQVSHRVWGPCLWTLLI